MSYQQTRKNRQIAIRKQRTAKYTDEYHYEELSIVDEQFNTNRYKVRNIAFIQAYNVNVSPCINNTTS